MFKFFKRVRNEMKKEAKLYKTIKRVERSSMDYELLRQIINATADSISPVSVEIKLSDGATINIKPEGKNPTGYVSFKDKYNTVHAGV